MGTCILEKYVTAHNQIAELTGHHHDRDYEGAHYLCEGIDTLQMWPLQIQFVDQQARDCSPHTVMWL